MEPHPPTPLRAGGAKNAAWWTVTASLLSLIALLAFHVADLRGRFQEIEAGRLGEDLELRSDLFSLHDTLQGLNERLADSATELDRAGRMSRRLGHAEHELGEVSARVQAASTRLGRVLAEQERFPADRLEQELARLGERLESRWSALNALASSAQEAATVSLTELERIEAGLGTERDLNRMWREIVGPVVQLSGELSVGSGVLLTSEPTEDGGYATHLVTAWHVVRDIQGDLSKTDMPVPVAIYALDGSIRHEEAELLAHDADIDVALLRLATRNDLLQGARLAPRSRLESVAIFDQVYAVGCPLGNDPIPTWGEIATVHHDVDGRTYWMINAPTYIGNSGGGIFDSSTHELLGIFSKIYTHGTLRPTIVPHMGLVTPLAAVYDWLETQGYGELVPRGVGEPLGIEALASATQPE